MPLLIDSSYRAPLWLRNPHLHTIVAAKMRKGPTIEWSRQRIDTPDGDFIDLDILGDLRAGASMERKDATNAAGTGARTTVLLLHGLEGSSSRTYIRGMAAALQRPGTTVIAVNFRGCSGEPNRLARSYHSGATEDLRTILEAVGGAFSRIHAVGFSLGGNMLLKYLGEEGSASRIERAVAVSVPCDLAGSAHQLATRENRLYMWNFMRSLRAKMQQKASAFPGQIDIDGLESMTTFHEFDDRFTAPLHGFRDAEHYWASCSSMHFLSDIHVPTLLLNAIDDPFLSEGCFPIQTCNDSEFVTLEMPETGGHVGFLARGVVYSERRAASFLEPRESGVNAPI